MMRCYRGVVFPNFLGSTLNVTEFYIRSKMPPNSMRNISLIKTTPWDKNTTKTVIRSLVYGFIKNLVTLENILMVFVVPVSFLGCSTVTCEDFGFFFKIYIDVENMLISQVNISTHNFGKQVLDCWWLTQERKLLQLH